MQNELIGDLQSEFTGAAFPDGAEALPLDKLAQQISNYTTLGKILKGRVSKLVGAKMPVGLSLSSLRDHLRSAKGLGDGSIDTVLVHAVTMEPKLRLGNEQEAFAWLEGVLSQAGIVVGSSGSSASPVYAMQPQNLGAMSALSQQFDALIQAQRHAMGHYLGMFSDWIVFVMLTPRCR
jgi:fatty acid synthase subunit beta